MKCIDKYIEIAMLICGLIRTGLSKDNVKTPQKHK